MDTESTRKFHIHPKVLITRMALIVLMMAVVPVLVLVTGDRVGKSILSVVLIIEASILVFVFWLMYSYIYVAVSPEGIRYRSLGYTITSSWENIAAIQERWMTNEGNVEGLALRGEGTQVNPMLRVGGYISRDSRAALKEARDFIPLSTLFTSEWRGTEIGAEIRKYAPQVFETP